jgi:hypothetical protein
VSEKDFLGEGQGAIAGLPNIIAALGPLCVMLAEHFQIKGHGVSLKFMGWRN